MGGQRQVGCAPTGLITLNAVLVSKVFGSVTNAFLDWVIQGVCARVGVKPVEGGLGASVATLRTSADLTRAVTSRPDVARQDDGPSPGVDAGGDPRLGG